MSYVLCLKFTQDPDPDPGSDPDFSEKSDPDPGSDPKKIIPDPQHCIFSKFICIAVQGVALKYEEEFHQALSSFARAQVSTGDFTPGANTCMIYSSLRESSVVDSD
jgi:hypothetical protein